MTSFDTDVLDAASSAPLADLFRAAFDDTAPEGILSFSFVPMAGLRRIAQLLGAARP